MNYNKIFLMAENAHRAGNLSVAEQHYQKIIDKISDVNALNGLATLYMQTKKFQQAIILFQQALKLEPNAADIIYNFSLCLYYNQEPTKAIELIKKVQVLLVNNFSLNIDFAKLCLCLQKPIMAIDILQPYSHHTIHSELVLADAYTQLQQWNKALYYWQQIGKHTEAPDFIWQKTSLCAAKSRQYPIAIKAFAKHMTTSPKQSLNHLKYADLLLLNKDINQAEKQLNIAIILNDNSLSRFELEAKIKLLQHKVNDAINAANKALEISSSSAIAWQILHEFQPLSAEKISSLKNIILTNNNDNDNDNDNFEKIQNTYILAKAYQQTKDYKQAFHYFKHANNAQYQQIIKNDDTYDVEQQKTFYQWLTTNAPEKKLHISSSEQPLFIVGMPRSGTTLVERLLDQHPDTKSSSENEALTFSLAHLYIQQKQTTTFNFTEYYHQNAIRLANEYQQFTKINDCIIIDKMPHNFLYVSAIIAIFPNAKIMQIRRNPADLALSIYCQHFSDSHNYACQLNDIAYAIFNANQLMDFWRQKYPDNVVDINYQQLVSAPERVAQNIFQFCQLEWQQQYINFYQKKVASFTFSELQVRKPINTNKINYWFNYKKEMQVFIDVYEKLITNQSTEGK